MSRRVDWPGIAATSLLPLLGRAIVGPKARPQLEAPHNGVEGGVGMERRRLKGQMRRTSALEAVHELRDNP